MKRTANSSHWSSSVPRGTIAGVVIAAGIALALANLAAQDAPQLTPGRNVNTAGGPATIVLTPDGKGITEFQGDPLLERDNEGTCDVDPLDPKHIVCANNSWAFVDVPPALDPDAATGDAWLRIAQSTNAGGSFTSRMLTGHYLLNSADDLASPIRQFPAGADPVFRFGTDGIGYLFGLAFDRAATPGGTSAATAAVGGALFVSRYFNYNDTENDPEPSKYVNQVVIAKTSTAKFQDKEWGAVDIPRRGAQMCTIPAKHGRPARSFLGGRVYVAYATFQGNLPNLISKGFIAYSADCGATWKSVQVSEGTNLLNGFAITIHPLTGWVDAVFRVFRDNNQPDSIQHVRSIDGGVSYTKPAIVATLPLLPRGDGTTVPSAFEQAMTFDGARMHTLPAATAGNDGKLYVVWSQRNPKTIGGIMTRDSKVVLSVGTPKPKGVGVIFAPPVLIDDTPLPTSATVLPKDGQPMADRRDHQFQPAIALLDNGNLMVTYYSLVQDHSTGEITAQKTTDPGDLSAPGVVNFLESREIKGDLLPSPTPESTKKVFTEFARDRADANAGSTANGGDNAPSFNHPQLSYLARKHTVAVRARIIGVADPSTRISQYRIGRKTAATPLVTLQDSPINRVMFVSAVYPDGIKRPTKPFHGDYHDIAPNSRFKLVNNVWLHSGFSLDSPVAYVAFTDNRDVKAPTPGATLNTNTAPAGLLAGTSFYSGDARLECDPNNTGYKNQNVYISQVTQGLYATAWWDRKRLGSATLPGFEPFDIQRAYVVVVRNDLNETAEYDLTLSSPLASFKQFEPLSTLTVKIRPHATIARSVFVRSSDPNAKVTVNIVNTANAALRASVVLNPGITGALRDPDGAGGVPDPNNQETYDPDLSLPGPNYDVTSGGVGAPDPTAPDPTAPDPTADPAYPDPTAPDPTAPDPTAPDPTAPDPTAPDPTADALNTALPDPTAPDPTAPDPTATATSDTTWTLTSNSNTSASHVIKLVKNKNIPPDVKVSLIVHRTSTDPVAVGCTPTKLARSELLFFKPNLTNNDPIFAQGDLGNADPTNSVFPTVPTSPKEKITITVRVVHTGPVEFSPPDEFGRRTVSDPLFNADEAIAPVGVAHAADTTVVQSNPNCGIGENPPCPTGGNTSAPPTDFRRLVFTMQPITTPSGKRMTVEVAVVDALGNTDPSSTASITLAIGPTNPNDGMLSGTLTKDAVQGVATFDDLSIDQVGNGYTLEASSSDLASTSDAFNILPKQILIYGPALAPTGGAITINEQTIAAANGYTVTVKDASQWSGTTTDQFKFYNAIVIPDKDCTALSPSPTLDAAEGNKATWSSAVTGNIVLFGGDPVFHANRTATRIDAATQVMLNSINFAASDLDTGMYMNLSCYYEFPPEGQTDYTITLLSAFGTFRARGPEANGDVNILEPSHPVMLGLTEGVEDADSFSLSRWGSSMHSWFTAFPSTWRALAEETTDGGTGTSPRIYIIANKPPVVPEP